VTLHGSGRIRWVNQGTKARRAFL